jgi:ankyrin repeat protein
MNNDFNINNQNDADELLLIYCYLEDLETIEYLLNSKELFYNANINYCNENKVNALIMAAQNQNKELVKFLLKSSKLKEHADIHHTTYEGNNILMLSCIANNLDMMKMLLTDPDLKTHSNLYETNLQNHNVLTLAVENRNIEIIDFLLFEMNIDVDEQTLSKIESISKDILSIVVEKIEKRKLKMLLDNELNQNKTISPKSKI